MFEEGDIVVCTNNMDDDGHVWSLTVGKEYEIRKAYPGYGEDEEDYVEIIDDKGREAKYRSARFKRAPLRNKPATIEVMY